MTNKKKNLARALATKTGMSYQAAINALAAGAKAQLEPVAMTEPVTRDTAQLLGLLHVATAFGVALRRASGGASADLKTARAQMEALAGAPIYYAESGAVQMVVAPPERDSLIQAGAVGEDVQVIRSFHHAHRPLTFAAQCSSCARWIWCGEGEHASECLCGQRYRVAFDRTPLDWSLHRGPCCMDCGVEYRLADTRAGLSPWSIINPWQQRCAHCSAFAARNGNMSITQDEKGQPIVRFTSQESTEDVDRFVADNALKVDWERAFVSATGSINQRRIELWRLPIVRGPE